MAHAVRFWDNAERRSASKFPIFAQMREDFSPSSARHLFVSVRRPGARILFHKWGKTINQKE
jgi:hypothetical protein